MIKKLINKVQKFLKFLENINRWFRKRRKEICSCKIPNCAFGHSEWCFTCCKSTGF